ncbi:MAG: antiviral reverse transcriptase Drt3a [Hydrogenophaga sp.]
MDQSFSEKSFLKLLRKGDAQKFSLGKTRLEIKKSLKDIENAANTDGFAFSSFGQSRRNNYSVYTAANRTDVLVLRKMADNVRRIFDVKTADRTELVPQAIRMIEDSADCTIFKLDIAQFFESIDRKHLLERLESSEALGSKTIELMKLLFSSTQFSSTSGLPRGLAVSPVLAEYYLKELENECRRIRYSHYYSRYVDDMLFFCHDTPEKLLTDVNRALPDGLHLNPDKTRRLVIDRYGYLDTKKSNCKSIVYLGYEIFPAQSKAKPLMVSIPEKKVKKIKTRIALSFMQFAKDGRYENLLRRMRFLSSNFVVGGSAQNGELYSGVYYNHKYANPEEMSRIFSDIDDFSLKLIYSKSGLGAKFARHLNNRMRKELASLSLRRGYAYPIYRDFKNEDLAKVKEVWQYA